MKIASHNTMTYLSPRQWWLWPFHFMAKCQSKSVEKQILDHNVRMVDLRVRFDSNNRPVFAHGQMEYKGYVENTLDIINCCGELLKEKIYVMISLEWPKKEGLDMQCILFRNWCERIQERYKDSNVILCGGGRKYDWAQAYNLGPVPSYVQMVSSTTWKIWDDWCPWFYARLMNKRNRKKNFIAEFVSFDFVQIQ